jgi:hypothetical protein
VLDDLASTLRLGRSGGRSLRTNLLAGAIIGGATMN